MQEPRQADRRSNKHTSFDNMVEYKNKKLGNWIHTRVMWRRLNMQEDILGSRKERQERVNDRKCKTKQETTKLTPWHIREYGRGFKIISLFIHVSFPAQITAYILHVENSTTQ